VPDVAVAGLRARGLDAEHGELAGGGHLRGQGGRRDEGIDVGHRVVGCHDEQQRIVAVLLPHEQGGDRGRRCGVAGLGFEHDRRVLDADLAQLFGDDETVTVATDHERRRGAGYGLRALHGGLHQAGVAQQTQELLGIGFARQRPEPCARAAGQQAGNDHCGLPPIRFSSSSVLRRIRAVSPRLSTFRRITGSVFEPRRLKRQSANSRLRPSVRSTRVSGPA